MSESASDRSLAVSLAEKRVTFQALGWPEDITELGVLHSILGELMQARKGTYLALPGSLAVLEQHDLYTLARPPGRGCYFDEQFELDECDELVRVPHVCTRLDIYEHLKVSLNPLDPRLAATTPLPFRVGLAVGWLSGLAVSQKEDIRMVMEILGAMVRSLLFTISLASDAPALGKTPARRALSAGKGVGRAAAPAAAREGVLLLPRNRGDLAALVQLVQRGCADGLFSLA